MQIPEWWGRPWVSGYFALDPAMQAVLRALSPPYKYGGISSFLTRNFLRAIRDCKTQIFVTNCPTTTSNGDKRVKMTFLSGLGDIILSRNVLDSKLVAIAASFLAIPFLTYCFTLSQHLIASSKSRYAATEPPLVPYSIPVLGSAIPFSFNTGEYVRGLR
jgi:hypothetical protein